MDGAGQHPLVAAETDLEQQLDPAVDVPKRQIITMTPGRNHCNGEAPPRAGIDGTGQQRAEKGEEDQWLDDREDQREGIAQDQRHLADEHRSGVGGETVGRSTRRRELASFAFLDHAATSSSSRRLRPVKLRNTSSSVGTQDVRTRTVTGAVQFAKQARQCLLPVVETRVRTVSQSRATFAELARRPRRLVAVRRPVRR